jgi:transposase
MSMAGVPHGLLAPSFVPPPEIRGLRMLTPYRIQLLGDLTSERTRLEGRLMRSSHRSVLM